MRLRLNPSTSWIGPRRAARGGTCRGLLRPEPSPEFKAQYGIRRLIRYHAVNDAYQGDGMPIRIRHVAGVLGMFVAAAFVVAGCDRATDELPREPASGTVTFDGRPLESGTIQ